MTIQCHYDVLGVPRDADAATIKKHHRKMALKLHPDKNIGDDTAADRFRLVQQAYECLSDPQERKWYDEHRDAILAGWSANADNDDLDMLFDVAPFMYAGCFNGFHDDAGGFYDAYKTAFTGIVQCETRQSEVVVDLPVDFGNSATPWAHVANFYQHWESFNSALNFAWEDKFNSQEDAPSRRVRRLMDDENRKARRTAKKAYNQDIVALVTFIKRRDPRVRAKKAEMEKKKQEREETMKQQAVQRKEDQQKAKEAWLEESRREMEEAEEKDRLQGRIRLADLDEDYDYGGGGKKKRGKKKKKWRKNQQQMKKQQEEEEEAKRQQQQEQQQQDEEGEGEDGGSDAGGDAGKLDKDGDGAIGDNDNGDTSSKGDGDTEGEAEIRQNGTDREDGIGHDVGDGHNGIYAAEDDADDFDDYESSESEEEPEIWRCECCKKDFKSEGQMENHMKSKKHKEKAKKFAAAMKKKEEQLMNDMMDEMMLDS